MTVISVTEAKKQLLELVRAVAEQGKVYSVTRRGAPAAVLMSEKEYRSVVETLEVLSDPQEYEGIMKGRADIAAGRMEELHNVIERLQG